MSFFFRRSKQSGEVGTRRVRARARFLSLMEEGNTNGNAAPTAEDNKPNQVTVSSPVATSSTTSSAAATITTITTDASADTSATDVTSDDSKDAANTTEDTSAENTADMFSDEGTVYIYGGKKKALLIGILYVGTSNELSGCANDARRIRQFLIDRYDFPESNIRLLTDDPNEENAIPPTTANIRKGIEWLVRDARAKDSLFFFFSGHGTSITDVNGDEPDGMDEAICPVDCNEEDGDCILDDELHETMVEPLPERCQLTAFFDSCHSGSVLDLPYVYTTDGQLKNMNIMKHVSRKLYSAGSDYMMYGMDKVKERLRELGHEILDVRHIEKMNRAYRSSPARVVMFSGCKDTQYSNDVGDTGALTAAFLAVVTEDPDVSYQDILARIRNILQDAGFSRQTPQLSTAHEIDTSDKFIM